MCPNKLWAANTSWPNYMSGIVEIFEARSCHWLFSRLQL